MNIGINSKIILRNNNDLTRRLKNRPRLGVSRGSFICLLKQFFLLSSLFLAACSYEFTDSASSKGQVLSISLNSETVYLSEVDSQYDLDAVAVDADGVAYLEQPVFEWQSHAEDIVQIDSDGVITAKAMGQATITVSTEGASVDVLVIISDEVLTLQGTVRYEDREYYSGGFTSRTNYFKAVRFAQILLMDPQDGVIQTVFSDANGNFSITGVINNQQEIIVTAVTNSAEGFALDVQDRSGDVFAVTKAISISQDNRLDIDIPLSNGASGAFNILDVFTNAAQFTLEFSDETLVTLSAFWQPGNKDGTYFCDGFNSFYCNQGSGVYIYNSIGGDTDEYDDDVLYHEYGHYFTEAFSRDDSQGGCHLLSSRDLDLRLSWSEGWGDFLPAAIKSWLASDPTRAGLLSTEINTPIAAYIDTYGTGSQIFVDLDNLSVSRYATAANELAVAKVLWVLSQRYGMRNLIGVLSNYFPQVATPVNLEAFWDGWMSSFSPLGSELSLIQATFNERSIYYQLDEYEEDNSTTSSVRTAVLGQAETHYLYNSQTDVDVIAFNAQQGANYNLETLNLSSGADTFLRVLAPNGAPLSIAGVAIENDDDNVNAYYAYDSVCGSSRVHNNGSALSSKVSFSAPTTGTYYAEISTTPDNEPYLSAGRYGTYDFKVTQN